MNLVFTLKPMLKRNDSLQVVLILIFFGLRLWLHDTHGLDGDDGFTVNLLRYDPKTLIDGLRTLRLDVHPPAYYLLLKGWVALLGQSLIMLRLPNIFMDLLTGVLLMRLSHRLLPGAGLWIVALIWGMAPLLLYTDRILRMYTLLMLLGTVGLLALVEAARSKYPSRRNQWGALSVFAALTALYTHIFGLLIVTGLAATLLAQMIRHKISPSRFWISLIGLVAAVAAFVPFVLPRIERLLQGGEISGQNPQLLNALPQIPGQVLLALFIHMGIQGAVVGWISVILLLFVGFWLLREKPALMPVAAFFFVLYALLIVAASQSFYRPRYLVILFPSAALLLGGALASLRWRIGRVGGLCAVLILSVIGIRANFSPALTDDFRAAAQFLEERARSQDRIIIIPEWGSRALNYHYQGDAEIFGMLSGVSDDLDLDVVLAPEIAGWERIWLIRFQQPGSDPNNRLPHWFMQRGVSITDVYPSGMHIAGYDLSPTMQEIPADVRSLEAEFGGILRLRGVDQPVQRAAASDEHLHPPSNWIPVTLYWEALQPIPQVEIRVRMTGAYGQTWGLAFQRGGDTFQRYPLHSLEMGTIYEAYYDVNLNPVSPPGEYWLEVMVFDETGAELSAAGADAEANRVLVGAVEIE